jgi:hypothetical protein
VLWFWLVLLVICLIVLVILLSYIRSDVHFSRVSDNDQLSIVVKALFGLIRYRFDVPIIQFQNWSKGVMVKAETVNTKSSKLIAEKKHHIDKDRVVNLYERFKVILEHTVKLFDWVKETLCRVECTKLVWTTRVGVGDAPETAITTGMVWAIKSSMLGFIMKYVQVHTKPLISVFPEYNRTQFSTELKAATRIRVVFVIWAGIRLLMQIIKVKGGIKAWYQAIFKPKIKMVTE